MAYTEDILIRTRDCDMFGRWKPSAILETMQETATAHCESVDLGRAKTDERGVVWVVSRCRVEFVRPLRLNEPCRVETFALPEKHLFYPRGHLFLNGAGETVGGALSLWLLMDIATRRIVKNASVSAKLPIEDADPGVKGPETVRPLQTPPTVSHVTPQFTEFDVNGHANNTKYMDWCWNALGMEALKGRELAAFDVNYDSEILPGEAIRTELYRAGEDAYVFCGGPGEKRSFGVSVELRDAE